MNKLIIALVSFITFLPLDTFSQSIEGLWKVTKGSTDITLEIKNNTGTVLSISSTKEFTDKIIGGNLYTNIVSIGAKKWKANRYTWRYNGTSREEQEKGWWTQVADSELSLSEDGNTLTASGHWTWKRVNPLKQEGTTSAVVKTNSSNTQNSNNSDRRILATMDVNHEGVKINYTTYAENNGRDTIVVANLINTNTNIGSRVIFANSATKIAEVNLSPGKTIVQTIRTFPFEILVEFYPVNGSNNSTETMDWAKKKVREILEIKPDGGVKRTPVGGSRG